MPHAKEDGENRMLKITLATSNKHKVDEINLIAKDYDIEFVLPEGDFDPVEDGSDFLQNAYCKVKEAIKTGSTKYYLADDSGLCVDCLDGAPGIYSARFASNPKERIDKLLDILKDKPNKKDRCAHFTCAMVLCDKKGKVVFQTQKKCFGYILDKPIGEGGFGYDPIFFVESEKMSMAQLSKEQKASVSHRSLALNEVLSWLVKNY